MRLYRLSGADVAGRFDGGYGLVCAGRWNDLGMRVTYAATVPALCLLEKLVHIQHPDDLPDGLRLVTYEAPDDIAVQVVEPEDLPADWSADPFISRSIAGLWYRERTAPILRVPSAVVPVEGAADRNLVVNHDHPEVGRIEVLSIEPFTLDPRLGRTF